MFSAMPPSQAYQSLKKNLEDEQYSPRVPIWGESDEIIKLKEQQKRKILIEEYLDAALKEEEEYCRSVGFCYEKNASSIEDTAKEIFAGNDGVIVEENNSGCQSKAAPTLQRGEISSISTQTHLPSTDNLSDPRPISTKRKNTLLEDKITKIGQRRKLNPTRTRRKNKFRKKEEHLNTSSPFQNESSSSHGSQFSSRQFTGEEVRGRGNKPCHSRSKKIKSSFSLLPENNLHEKRWKAKALQLLEYNNKYGHCDISQNDPEFAQLGRWIRTQRIAYKGKYEGQGGMHTQRIIFLEAVGVKWECRRGKNRTIKHSSIQGKNDD